MSHSTLLNPYESPASTAFSPESDRTRLKRRGRNWLIGVLVYLVANYSLCLLASLVGEGNHPPVVYVAQLLLYPGLCLLALSHLNWARLVLGLIWISGFLKGVATIVQAGNISGLYLGGCCAVGFLIWVFLFSPSVRAYVKPV